MTLSPEQLDQAEAAYRTMVHEHGAPFREKLQILGLSARVLLVPIAIAEQWLRASGMEPTRLEARLAEGAPLRRGLEAIAAIAQEHG
jgi:hypothetical protein